MVLPQASPAQSAQSPAEPKVSGFRIQAKRLKQPTEIAQKLSELSFLEMTVEKDSLIALNVESRDIQKNPYLFSIVYFRPTMIEVLYSCPPTLAPKKRRLDVLRHFLNLLTLVDDCYKVEMKQIYQLLEASFAQLSEYVSTDYDRLFALYDNLKTDFAQLQKKYNDAKEASASLSKENYELKTKNDELTLKLKSLETFSDTILALKIQEWLAEHKGEINIADFAKVYNVPETRVEQMLNKLVTEGYLETKG
ncbi:MAG: hypothetical protein N3G80_03770 [Candidatus Micrarchaeota archaeon]|nr:hypothetical protein [Candidatus Micrarchaeota archaeon]